MKYIKNTIIAILSISMLYSCTEDIDMEFDTTYNRLVVEGYITNERKAHEVRLSRSNDALNKKEIVMISGADVIITDGTDTFRLTESANKGVYLTSDTVQGIPGHVYTLRISGVDVDDNGPDPVYTASSELRPISPIDSIEVLCTEIFNDFKIWTIHLYGWDYVSPTRNYYLTKAYRNDTLVSDSIKEVGFTSNAGFEGQYYEGFGVYSLVNNDPTDIVLKDDTVTLELNSITEEYYQFVIGFIQEYNPKNPIFSGPSANVPTNVFPKDKAVGFFAAYSVARKSTVYDGLVIKQ